MTGSTDSASSKPSPKNPFLLPDVSDLVVGVLGGTGEQGRGLAYRWACDGQRILLGSRDRHRAESAARDLGKALPVSGMTNAECAAQADVVVAAVPWAGHADLLTSLKDQLAGKILVDCVNPLGFDKQGAYALEVPQGSAAQQAAALLPDSRIVAAFHHISAVLLLDPSVVGLDTDVLVLGDDREATDTVQALAGRLPGVRGIYGGRLRNAHQVEAMTANLISMNRRYKAHAGIRVTDL